MLRFGALGAVTSATSIAAYAVLSLRAPVPVAWTTAYLLGLGVTTSFTDRVVFSNRAGRRARLLASVGYVLVFLLGLSVVWLLQSRLDLLPVLAGATSVTISAPLNYLLGRRLFLAQPPSEDEVPVHEEKREQPESAG